MAKGHQSRLEGIPMSFKSKVVQILPILQALQADKDFIRSYLSIFLVPLPYLYPSQTAAISTCLRSDHIIQVHRYRS